MLAIRTKFTRASAHLNEVEEGTRGGGAALKWLSDRILCLINKSESHFELFLTLNLLRHQRLLFDEEINYSWQCLTLELARD
jgi:hypothetical protein